MGFFRKKGTNLEWEIFSLGVDVINPIFCKIFEKLLKEEIDQQAELGASDSASTPEDEAWRNEGHIALEKIEEFVRDEYVDEIVIDGVRTSMGISPFLIAKGSPKMSQNEMRRGEHLSKELFPQWHYLHQLVVNGGFVMMPGKDLEQTAKYRGNLTGNFMSNKFGWDCMDPSGSTRKRADSILSELIGKSFTEFADVYGVSEATVYLAVELATILLHWERSTYRSALR